LDANPLDDRRAVAVATGGSRGRIGRGRAVASALVFFFSFLTTAVVAASSSGGGVDECITVHVAAVEIERLPEVSYQLMEKELAGLLEPTALRVRWRRTSPPSETRRDEIRVVFLDGPGRGLHADPSILAAARHALPDPTIWVYTPSVRAALASSGEAGSPAARRALGLALGRVLAHELVHVLAPDVPHGHGIMAERFRMVGLGETRPALLPLCAKALDDGARAWAARSSRIGRATDPGSATGGPGRLLAAR